MAIQALTAYYAGEGSAEKDRAVFDQVVGALQAKDIEFAAPRLVEFDEHPGEPASTWIAPVTHCNFIQIIAAELTSPVLRRRLDGMWCDDVLLHIDYLLNQ